MSMRSWHCRSTMKHSGALMSSRFIPPNVGSRAATTSQSRCGCSAATLSSMSYASMSANVLKSTALPSITGLEASAPMFPSPSTAEPFVTTPTRWPLLVYSYTCAGFFCMATQGSATPGLYATDRSCAVPTDLVGTVSILPFLPILWYLRLHVDSTSFLTAAKSFFDTLRPVMALAVLSELSMSSSSASSRPTIACPSFCISLAAPWCSWKTRGKKLLVSTRHVLTGPTALTLVVMVTDPSALAFFRSPRNSALSPMKLPGPCVSISSPSRIRHTWPSSTKWNARRCPPSVMIPSPSSNTRSSPSSANTSRSSRLRSCRLSSPWKWAESPPPPPPSPSVISAARLVASSVDVSLTPS
mmetsp:Transcript_11325/g.39389  ORF Transcript_11325/g.39389 Transcript_11325/m.39389 type:complete len:357 (-) Transcript_11325:443-1513(-)